MHHIYILAVIIAATLHASGTALLVTKDFKATIENGAAFDTVDAIATDGGRCWLIHSVQKNLVL
ncbi:hypothetical protein PI124_g14882 [Phytophthora idaei]|nr:hypothetical protein PI125_g13198 [Phytophthora idaei]KAG3145235.1 hypothetical protein PI126_g13816 [Phytophthora idaei]KAG3240216.1 hypothetical protein PI124_g14882 [Phytophthora idaei]